MDFEETINSIFEDKKETNRRVGMYAVQTDHPGLLKGIKKEKTNKVDRSFLSDDDDASRQYITGTVTPKGIKKNDNG